MLRIDVSVTPELLVFEAVGPLSGQAIAEAIRQHHRLLVGRECLWDMRRADFSSLAPQPDFKAISGTAREVTAERSGGKVAYVVADAQAYLVMCKYMNHTLAARVHMEYAVFQDIEEARRWLRQDASITPAREQSDSPPQL